MTEIYVNQIGVADAVGISAFTMHQERKAGLLMDPDVLVGDRPGWSPQRVGLYRRYRAEGHLREGDRPEWWRVPRPLTLLKVEQVAARLGVVPVTITMTKQRGRFPDPVARITRDPQEPKPRDMFGWEEPAIVEYGKFIGWLDKAGRIAPIRGGGPPRKVFADAEEAA